MKWFKHISLILLLMVFGSAVSAQDIPSDSTIAELEGAVEAMDTTTIEIDTVAADFVAIKTKKFADSVIIRWAPSNRALWLRAQKAGYMVTRYTLPEPGTVTRDTQIETKILADSLNPLLPWDSAQWAPYFPNEDDFALIAAGASGGQLELQNGGSDRGFAAKAKQDESIYGMILLAADRSALGAAGLALRIVDRELEVGKTYVYDVRVVGEPRGFGPAEFLAESIVAFDGQPEQDQLVGLDTESMEHSVKLLWPSYENRHFSSYHIQRSADGGRTYDSLTTVPYITQEVYNDSLETAVLQYIDSVEDNYVTHLYKVIGLDAFASTGEPGVIRGMGVDLTPPKNPIIRSGELQDDGTIRVSWQLPEIPDDFAELRLERSHDPQNFWKSVSEEPLPTQDTVYIFTPEAESSNYFRVTAADTAGNVSASFPIFVDVMDSIPPATPLSLGGEIDTTGTVTLYWQMGEELDLKGYRVYYANKETHEYTQLTAEPVYEDTVSYQIPLNTLTEEIFYKVQAVDNHYNHSEFTDVLKLSKPDTIPPVPPVFNTPRVDQNAVMLTWRPSSSKDVVMHVINRSLPGSEETTSFEVNSDDNSYRDASADKGVIYEYTIQAVDDADNLSDNSFPVRARVIDKKRMPTVEDFRVQYIADKQEVELEWSYSEEGDFRYSIYRNIDNEKVKRYKSVQGGELGYLDKVKGAGTYYYAIKVISSNGSKSLLSAVVSVQVN